MGTMDPRVYYLDESGKYWVMHDHVKVQYRKVMNKQLEEWEKGNPLHSDQLGPGFELPEGVECECCPDFSCCFPEIAWSPEIKAKFIKASKENHEELKMQLLMGSMDAMLDYNAKQNQEEAPKVHIAGLVSPDETMQ